MTDQRRPSKARLRLRDQAFEECTKCLDTENLPASVPILYHLTDAETAVKICRSETLWASEASTTNDASEVSYGRSRGLQTLGLIDRGRDSGFSFEELLDTYILRPELNSEQSFEIRNFVTSFCSQEGITRAASWLHYGRQGTGIAVGFRLPALLPNFLLRKIDYSHTSQGARIARLFEAGRRSLKMSDSDVEGSHRFVAHIVQAWLSALAVQMKDRAFEGEDEWRLIYLEGRQAIEPAAALPKGGALRKDLRFGKFGQTIPYVQAKMPPAAVTEMVLGFSSRASADHIREQLPDHLIDIPITRSIVPVRPT